MTTYVFCSTCRQQHSKGQRCPYRPAKRATGPARSAQRRARNQAIAAGDGRCVAIVNGIRCDQTTNLAAAHIQPYAQTGSYNGIVLMCDVHHREWDRQQRRGAVKARP